MESLSITLNTLTPLWTGGIDGITDRLHETGIIGSLRWWYEAMVRGLGSNACDPSSHSCIFDVNEFKKSSALTLDGKLSDAGLCNACQIFGATGWKRRFRMLVAGGQEDATFENKTDSIKTTTGNRYKRDGSTRPSWYFRNGPGQTGSFQLNLISLSKDFDLNLLLGPLYLITGYGGLAAKNQLGYGWVNFDQRRSFDPNEYQKMLCLSGKSQPEFPALSNMFFTEIETNDHGITATLNAKYDVRQIFRTIFTNRELRHFICGTVQGQRQGAKVFFSQAVNGKMRIWGWVPDKLPFEGITRSQVVDAIYNTLVSYGKITYWREFSSHHDTITPKEKDRNAFFVSMLREVV